MDRTASRASSTNVNRFGYKEGLPVSLSMVSILGLSFAIIAAPYGLSTTMAIGLTTGGPVTIIWGWVTVMLISTCIAASLGELSSVYPTSGGIYFWTAKVSPPAYAPLISYVDGWLNTVGNWLILLSINFGGAQLILSAPGIWNPEYAPKNWQVLLTFWAIMILCALVNLLPNRYLDQLNHACMYWTGASVIIILITLLAMADTRNSGQFVFGEFDPSPSGYPSGWAWCVGLLQPTYVITAYGMIASLAEETSRPETEVAKAMVLSVAFAAITGLLYLIPILFVIPRPIVDLLTEPTGQPIGRIFASAAGISGGFGLLFLIFGILAFAGIGAMTAASRTAFAFSRDGAIPGSQWWKKVSPRFGQPVNAIILTTLVDSLIALIYLGSPAAFNAFVGAGTLCLTAAYGVPVLMSVIAGRRHVKHAVWSLGKLGWAFNIITIAWVPLAAVLFCSPTAIPVTPASMNYASVVFMFFAGVATLWYVVWGKKNFKGPVLDDVQPVLKGGVSVGDIAKADTEKKAVY